MCGAGRDGNGMWQRCVHVHVLAFVVHRAGMGNRLSARMETLYRSFDSPKALQSSCAALQCSAPMHLLLSHTPGHPRKLGAGGVGVVSGEVCKRIMHVVVISTSLSTTALYA